MNPEVLGAFGVLLIITAIGGLVAVVAGAVVAALIVLALLGTLLVWIAWVLHSAPVSPPTGNDGPAS